MCIDDYEFKHYSSIKGKICKRLHFMNEDQEERIYLMNIGQFQQYGKIDLSKILHHLAKKCLVIQGHLFYMPQLNMVINPNQPCLITMDDIQRHQDLIFHMYTEGSNINQHPTEITAFKDEDSLSTFTPKQQTTHQHQPQHIKKLKQPQRKIGEVIEKVKQWRLMHEIKHINLTEAAKIVGICKKSLDDYYLILRIGQYCDFDYAHHLNQGMGFLRAFIKMKDAKTQGRLPIQISNFKVFQLIPQKNISQDIQDMQPQLDLNLCKIKLSETELQ